MRHATPGSADFCLLTRTPLATVADHLAAHGVRVILGPVRRTGALGPIESLYFHDPDENLVEVANLVTNVPWTRPANRSRRDPP